MIDRNKLLNMAVTIWAMTTITLVGFTFLAWLFGICWFLYKII